MMPASVVIVIESLGGGGAQHVATTLANAWCARGMRVTMITFRDEGSDAFHLDERVSRQVLGGSRASTGLVDAVVANVTRVLRLRRALKNARAPCVLSFVGSTNVLTVLAAAGLGLRVVVSERNDPARQSLGRIWDFARRLLYRRAALVSANSRVAVEAMSAYVPRHKLCWLPNPLRMEPDGSMATRGIAVSVPFFVAVGRLEPQKAYDVLLEAFALVAAELPEWQLVLLGDGPEWHALSSRALRPDLSGRVHFQGFMENPFPWYRRADVLVHPALFEGLPNVVIEAMSEGVPVIVTDMQTGLQGIVQANDNGLVVAAGSVEELKDAMLVLAGDAELRRRMGDAARRVAEVFHADKAIAAWTDVLANA